MRIEEKYRKRKKAFHCILVYYHLCLALILACMRVPWLYFFLLLLLCIVDCGPVLCNTNVKYEFYAQHPFTCWIFTWITLNTNIPEWFQYSNRTMREDWRWCKTLCQHFINKCDLYCATCVSCIFFYNFIFICMWMEGWAGWPNPDRKTRQLFNFVC